MRIAGLTSIAPGLYSYKSPVSAQGITYTFKRRKRNEWRIFRPGSPLSQSFNVYHDLGSCIAHLNECGVKWVNPASSTLDQLMQAGFCREVVA